MLSKIIQWDVIKSLLLHISKCIDPMFQNMQSLESVSDAIRVIFARTLSYVELRIDGPTDVSMI